VSWTSTPSGSNTSDPHTVSSYRFITGDRVEFEPAVTELAGTHTPYCWGCGPDSREGLGLRPLLDGCEPIAELEFDPRFEGGPGTVHGGAIAAFVDDLLGYVPVVYGAPGVTARLDTNYRKPVPLGVVVHGRAWMSKVDGDKMWAEGTIEAGGDVYVEASALFIAISFEHYRKVHEQLTEEQLARSAAYRSGEYFP
jgi:acyl-coenzyme A thioesterase PaaI-like protein